MMVSRITKSVCLSQQSRVARAQNVGHFFDYENVPDGKVELALHGVDFHRKRLLKVERDASEAAASPSFYFLGDAPTPVPERCEQRLTTIVSTVRFCPSPPSSNILTHNSRLRMAGIDRRETRWDHIGVRPRVQFWAERTRRPRLRRQFVRFGRFGGSLAS